MRLCVAALVLAQIAAAGLRTDVEYARAGETHLLLDAWTPEGRGPFSAVIWVHGGGFTGGDKRPYPKELLSHIERAGFAWFSVNYRLAPRSPFPAPGEDIERAVAFVKSRASEFHVNPDRLVLMGASAGAHLVSLVGARHAPANRVAAVVALYGEHDLVGRAHPTGDCILDERAVPHAGPMCLSPGLAAYLGIQADSPGADRVLREASPASYVRRDMPPYLLLHGTQDLGVPYEQSQAMCKLMQTAGARCKLITIAGGGHGGWDADPAMSGYKEEIVAWLLHEVR